MVPLLQKYISEVKKLHLLLLKYLKEFAAKTFAMKVKFSKGCVQLDNKSFVIKKLLLTYL